MQLSLIAGYKPAKLLGAIDMTTSHWNLFTEDVAMDLGTANTLIYVRGKGIVLDEPSVVTLDRNTGAVVSVGADARESSGRHSRDFTTFRPLKGGVVNDFEAASSMIRYFLKKVFKRTPFFRPRLIVAVPASISTAEKRALMEAAQKAGAGRVFLIQEPVAAALGAGLRVDQPVGHFIVDIGGGSTDIAVVCKLEIACSESLRIAGDEIDTALCNYIRLKHRIEISETMAEAIKIKIGSVTPLSKKIAVKVRGKELSTGMPKTVIITDEDVRESLMKSAKGIAAAVKRVIESASPDLSSDISERGIWMTGGGALLKGWRRFFYDEAGIEVQLSNDPLRSTIRGAGTVVEQLSIYRKALTNGKYPDLLRVI
ncbi:MAG: rod shape-determining protein [Syntrophobacteraceae bacterium]